MSDGSSGARSFAEGPDKPANRPSPYWTPNGRYQALPGSTGHSSPGRPHLTRYAILLRLLPWLLLGLGKAVGIQANSPRGRNSINFESYWIFPLREALGEVVPL
jgi:hypothetical protein